jgi:uncharacterized protein
MTSLPAGVDPDAGFTWLNEPGRWRRDGEALTLTTEPDTDFWRHTHYGHVMDSGHFAGTRVMGDFTALVTVAGAYQDQYDQVGLMVRLDAERWAKCGIEYVDGRHLMSSVVTHAVSDWSMTPLEPAPAALDLRVTRDGDALIVEYSVEGADWQIQRVAYLPPGLPVLVGPMAASPRGTGFQVSFSGFDVTPR